MEGYKFLTLSFPKSKTDYTETDRISNIFTFERPILRNKKDWQVGVLSLSLFAQSLPLLIYDQSYFKIALEWRVDSTFFVATVGALPEKDERVVKIYNHRTICDMFNDAFLEAANALNLAKGNPIGSNLEPRLYWDEAQQKFCLVAQELLYDTDGTVNIYVNTNAYNKIFASMRCDQSTTTSGTANDLLYKVVVEPSIDNTFGRTASLVPYKDSTGAFLGMYQEYNSASFLSDLSGVRIKSQFLQMDPEVLTDANNINTSVQAGDKDFIILDLSNDNSSTDSIQNRLSYFPGLDSVNWHDLKSTGSLQQLDVVITAITTDNREINIPIPTGKNVILKLVFRKIRDDAGFLQSDA